MAARLVLLSALVMAPAALAQSSTQSSTQSSASSSVVTLVLPGFDSQTIDASVVAAEATATTYFLACPTDEDSSDCGLGTGLTAIEGPSTISIHFPYDATTTGDLNCAVSFDTATCTNNVAGGDFAVTSLMTTFTDITSSYGLPVTVTAGLDLLVASSTAASNATNATVTAASITSAQPTTQVIDGSGSLAGTTTRPGASSSTSKAGVAPGITQHAVLVGFAAVVGGAMVL